MLAVVVREQNPVPAFGVIPSRGTLTARAPQESAQREVRVQRLPWRARCHMLFAVQHPLQFQPFLGSQRPVELRAYDLPISPLPGQQSSIQRAAADVRPGLLAEEIA